MRADRQEAVVGGAAWAALAALVAGHLALWAGLAGLPFQDIPNHLSRAVIIADLEFRDGERFGRWFEFEWSTLPYVLGDLLLLPLVELFPVDVAGRLWVALEWASLPAAVAVLLHVWRVTGAARLAALALACYLATDVFFLLGFANFRLGVALTLLALAAWERAQHAPGAPGRTGGAPAWGLYFALAVACYLMHLAALVFLVAAVGTLSAYRLWERRARLLPLAAAGAPLLVLLAGHVLLREAGAEAEAAAHAEWGRKLLRLASPLVRYDDVADVALFGVFVAVVVGPLLAQARARIDALDRELWLLTGAFVGVYFVLPEQQGAVWAIDNRALSLAWLWLAIAGARAAARSGARRLLVGATLALAAANLLALGVRLAPEDRAMRAYRELAATVPPGTLVLPILARPMSGFTNPLAHAASFATIDNGAIVPYTFSGNEGMPMRYFRFRTRPEAPWQFWFQHDLPPPDVGRVLERYDYLLVDLPVDWRRIPVAARVVRANEVVALARVARRSAEADGERAYLAGARP